MLSSAEELRIYIMFFLVGNSKTIKVNGVHYELDSFLKQKKKIIIYLEMLLLTIVFIFNVYLREIRNLSYSEFTISFFLTYAIGLIFLIVGCRFYISPKEMLNHLRKKLL